MSLQQSLDELSKWEKDMSFIEKDVEIYRLKKTQPMYSKRSSIIKSIPKFWYIIFAENDDFSEYIAPEDLKYLECISDIYINYPNLDKNAENFRDFHIRITFANSNGLIEDQEIVKKFQYKLNEEGEEILTSDPVDLKWPEELENINPMQIKQRTQGKEMSKQDKKNYRQGMKSFFAWFQWTGEKPGKEFRNGEELTNLLVDDLYLNALKYYVLALSNDDDEDDEHDSSEGEELDLSDNDDEDNDKKRKFKDDHDEGNFKKNR